MKLYQVFVIEPDRVEHLPITRQGAYDRREDALKAMEIEGTRGERVLVLVQTIEAEGYESFKGDKK